MGSQHKLKVHDTRPWHQLIRNSLTGGVAQIDQTQVGKFGKILSSVAQWQCRDTIRALRTIEDTNSQTRNNFVLRKFTIDVSTMLVEVFRVWEHVGHCRPWGSFLNAFDTMFKHNIGLVGISIQMMQNAKTISIVGRTAFGKNQLNPASAASYRCFCTSSQWPSRVLIRSYEIYIPSHPSID